MKTGNEYLRICYDLADRAKHYDLSKSAKYRRDPHTDTDMQKGVTIVMQAPLSMNNEHNKLIRSEAIFTFYITSDGKNAEAIGLAKNCVDGWKTFLSNNDIPLL